MIILLCMKISVNETDLKDAKRFDSFLSIIFNCKIKYCCFEKAAKFNFAVKNDARKAVETCYICKINLVCSDFDVQNVLFLNLQSACIFIIFLRRLPTLSPIFPLFTGVCILTA